MQYQIRRVPIQWQKMSNKNDNNFWKQRQRRHNIMRLIFGFGKIEKWRKRNYEFPKCVHVFIRNGKGGVENYVFAAQSRLTDIISLLGLFSFWDWCSFNASASLSATKTSAGTDQVNIMFPKIKFYVALLCQFYGRE